MEHYPESGETWTHDKTGNPYEVLYLANTAGDRWPYIVVYQDADENVWARPLDEWMDRYNETETQDR